MIRTVFLCLFCFTLPFFAAAETVVRVGDGIKVDEAQTVEGDYYVSVGPFGNTTMSGTVAEDMYALGGAVTVNGAIGADFTAVSGRAQLHASVTDDVRILAGEVTIAEPVGGDVFVVGGTLRVLSTAAIAGDIYFFGASALIDGPVSGSIYGNMERLRINSSIAGNVDVQTFEPITLGSKASVAGNVTYVSSEPLIRAPEAVVEGQVQERPRPDVTEEEQLQSFLIPLFVMLFAALSIYLLFGKEFASLHRIVAASYLRAAVVGFSVLVLGPVVSLLLMATVLGLLVGIASFAVTLLLGSLGLALAGAVCGMWLGSLTKSTETANLLWITLGTIGLYTASFVPIIGPLLFFTFVLLAIGGITIGLYRLQQ